MKLKCIIVDDEPVARKLLEEYISDVDFLELTGKAENPVKASALLNGDVDLMFLDINMPKMSGIEFLRSSISLPSTIMTTAYSEYALEGFELNVLDYLLKPINFNRFLMAVTKLKSQNTAEVVVNPQGVSTERAHLFININKKRVKIYLDEILYIESKREYISIVIKDRSFLTKFQLSEIEELLASNNFIRVHRSFIVAKNKIDAFTASDVEISGQQIPIGRSYKELVLAIMGEDV